MRALCQQWLLGCQNAREKIVMLLFARPFVDLGLERRWLDVEWTAVVPSLW